MEKLTNKQQFREFVTASNKHFKLVHFSAQWSAARTQLNELLMELQKDYEDTFDIAQLDAENFPEISLEHGVRAVPTTVAFRDGKILDKIEGFHPAKLKELIIKANLNVVSTIDSTASSEVTMTEKEDLNDRLKRLINTARLTLFMKGSPDAPRCGFSRQIVELLRSQNVDFWSFDILQDEQVRQGLKAYSDWPTYPQLYLDGELMGGLDVIREEMKDPAFVEKLPKMQ